MGTLSAAEVIAIAASIGVTRLGVKETLGVAESDAELDQEDTLNIMRALLMILEAAEGNP